MFQISKRHRWILLQIFLIRQRFLEHRKNYNSFGLRSINFRENTVRFENYSRTVKEESENVFHSKYETKSKVLNFWSKQSFKEKMVDLKNYLKIDNEETIILLD